MKLRAAMIVLLSICAGGAVGAGGCGPITFTIGPAPTEARIEPTVVQRDEGLTFDRVAVIDVSGLIVNAPLPGLLSERENPVGLLHEQLEAARRDPFVKAVLLRLNTPGGTVTASDAMYREVRRFRRLSGKPVVALMMDVAASGGYYVACAADRIVAYPTAITGSIGVIYQTVSFKPVMDRIGIEAEAITSGPNKDAGSPLSRLTEEHRRVIRAMVDDFHASFIDVVRRRRPDIPADRFERLTDGRVVTGRDAAASHLVDRAGDLYDAWAAAKELAGVERAHLAVYHRPGRAVGSAYAAAARAAAGSSAPEGAVQINLAQINLADTLRIGDATMAFMYLWRPVSP